MALKWHVEGWRKIYITKSPSWLRLPVSARGLGRELITYADDIGRIDIGSDDPGEAVAYLLGARPKEHQRIREDVAELIREGYLTVVPGFLVIRNFVEAQDRTPGAKRTAEWRARKSKASSPDSSEEELEPLREKSRIGASHVTSHETSRVTSHERLSVTSLGDGGVMSPRDACVTPIRVDPIKEEEIQTRAHEEQAPGQISASDDRGNPVVTKIREAIDRSKPMTPYATVELAQYLAAQCREGGFMGRWSLDDILTSIRECDEKLSFEEKAGHFRGPSGILATLKSYVKNGPKKPQTKPAYPVSAPSPEADPRDAAAAARREKLKDLKPPTGIFGRTGSGT